MTRKKEPTVTDSLKDHAAGTAKGIAAGAAFGAAKGAAAGGPVAGPLGAGVGAKAGAKAGAIGGLGVAQVRKAAEAAGEAAELGKALWEERQANQRAADMEQRLSERKKKR